MTAPSNSPAPTSAETVAKVAPMSGNRRIWIIIAVVVGGLIVANLVAQGLDRAVGGDQPGGATGSSYATADKGLAGFASLLTRYGHSVAQQRGSISDRTLPANGTVFVIEPNDVTADDAAALLRFADEGGRVVVGGESLFFLHDLADAPPKWQPDGDTTWNADDPDLGQAHDIEGAGVGSWSPSAGTTPLVGTDDFALLTRETARRGEILFLADATPLENAYLSSADNAAFALALAGDASRSVVFTEGVHGYGTSRGIAAIPDRWKVALLLIAFAAVAFVWSRAWRFGAPDRTARDLPPARAEYVEALSISLERTRERGGALAPAQRWARARLATRAGLGASPNDEDLVRAARSFGCTPEEVTALLAPVSDDAGVLAFGRAVTRVSGRDRRIQ